MCSLNFATATFASSASVGTPPSIRRGRRRLGDARAALWTGVAGRRHDLGDARRRGASFQPQHDLADDDFDSRVAIAASDGFIEFDFLELGRLVCHVREPP